MACIGCLRECAVIQADKCAAAALRFAVRNTRCSSPGAGASCTPAGKGATADSEARSTCSVRDRRNRKVTVTHGRSIETRFAQRAQREGGSIIREIAKVISRHPHIVSFAGGLPSAEGFPVDELRACFDRVLSQQGKVALQYGATDGYVPLRQWLADRLRSRGMQVGAENILITSGSQQGLDLVGRVFIDAGDRVYVESPTYVGATQALRAYDPTFVGLPCDEDGLVVGEFQSLLLSHGHGHGHGGRNLLYTVPAFQNPSARSMSFERRQALIELASMADLLVVEDDPYGELAFDGSLQTPLYALDPDRVVHLGSFSKILCPGIRLGYVVARPEIIQRMEQAKQGVDLHSSTLTQMAVHELVKNGFLDQHLQRVRRIYSSQCDVMARALIAHFPQSVAWAKPQGGMFMWLQLPEHLDTSEMLKDAIAVDVAYVPGAPFFVDAPRHNTMRLGFATASPAAIESGIARLAQVIETRSRMQAG